MNEIECLLKDLIDDADHSSHGSEPSSRLGLDILAVCKGDKSLLCPPLSRVEEMWHDLYSKLYESPDSEMTNPLSRVGAILNCILKDEEYVFEPLSRVEELLLELMRKYGGFIRTFEVFFDGDTLVINTNPPGDAYIDEDGTLHLKSHIAHIDSDEEILIFEKGGSV